MSRYDGTRLARFGGLGFDRNPLRRTRRSRVEAAVEPLATLILLLVAVPIVTLAIRRQADKVALARLTRSRRQITMSPPSCSARRSHRAGSLIRTPRSR